MSTENEEQAKKDFDKERQAVDQERANAARARAEAQAARQEAEALKQRMAALEQQIAEAKGKEDAAKSVDLPDIPTEEASIEALAEYARRAKKILADQAIELAVLKGTVTKSQKDKEQETEAQRQARYADQVLEEVCSNFDAEYGAEHRNEALKLMTAMNKEQGPPATPHKAMLRLKDCYRQAVKDSEKSKPPRIPSDSGRGGSRPSFKPASIKPGSLDEVAAQFAKT